MNILYKYLKAFIASDFRLKTYLPVAVYISICLIVNYNLDFEHKVLNNHLGILIGFVSYYVFYGIAYFPVAVYLLIMSNKQHILKQFKFWIYSGFIITLLAGSGYFSHYNDLAGLFPDSSERYFIRKLLVNSRNFLLFIIPLLVVWFTINPYKTGFLWIKLQKFDAKPYWTILLIMLPVVFVASFSKSFLNTYPTFLPWRINEVFGLNRWQMTGIYELFYSVDFITVEMIFRGALVLGMSKWLGKECILPMVTVYCFLHFGKPMGEAIGSIFGGYVLGVVALNTESIVGGCMVHMGIALMMEMFAFGQHYI